MARESFVIRDIAGPKFPLFLCIDAGKPDAGATESSGDDRPSG
jgi:hypothetical protein